MLELQHLTKAYGKNLKPSVDNLCLSVKPGQIFGFIGPNGAGKTTTIRMLTGILTPDQGTVTVDGFDMEKSPIQAKERIGFVPDGHDLFERMTGITYLNFVANMYGVPADVRKEKIQDMLAKYELADAAGSQIRSYSRGMKQKLAVIASLLHAPRVWVLDEPMVGLDPRASHLLKQEMRAHADAGNVVFFSTHVLEVAEKLCDQIGIINKGVMIASGSLEEIRRGEQGVSLEQLFLEMTDKEGAAS